MALANSELLALGAVTPAAVAVLKTVSPAEVFQIDGVEKVVNTATSGAAEVVPVAGNSVEVAVVTEAVVGTGLSLEELAGIDMYVVRVPLTVAFVVGVAVAEAVVAV